MRVRIRRKETRGPNDGRLPGASTRDSSMRRHAWIAALIAFALATFWKPASPPREIEWEWEPEREPALVGELAELAVERARQALRYRVVSQPAEDSDGTDETHLSEQSKSELKGLHRYLKEQYPHVFDVLQIDIVSDWSLLIRWPGTNRDKLPVLLVSHLDVVPPGNESLWSTNPFGGNIVDGYIYGRGALDTRLTALAILEALEKALRVGRKPERSIYVALGHDEEVGGSSGAAKMAEYLRTRKEKFELVLDEGGAITVGVFPKIRVPVAVIGVAEKGSVVLRIRIRGSGGHTSAPQLDGTDTPTLAGKIIVAFQRNQMYPKPTKPLLEFLKTIAQHLPFVLGVPIRVMVRVCPWLITRVLTRIKMLNPLSRTTCAATICSFGERINVVPNQAELHVHYRPLRGDSVEDILRHAESVVGQFTSEFSIDVLEAREPSGDYYVRRNFELVEQCIVETFGNHSKTDVEPSIIVSPYITIGGTDSRYYEKLANGGVFKFSPIVLNSATNDFSRIHGVDERISVKNYLRMVDFYDRFLELVAVTA